MFGKVFKWLFGSKNDRELKRMRKLVTKINQFEESLQALTDEQLKSKTAELKQRLAANETLDQLLPEAFAVVREASRRTLGLESTKSKPKMCFSSFFNFSRHLLTSEFSGHPE